MVQFVFFFILITVFLAGVFAYYAPSTQAHRSIDIYDGQEWLYFDGDVQP